MVNITAYVQKIQIKRYAMTEIIKFPINKEEIDITEENTRRFTIELKDGSVYLIDTRANKYFWKIIDKQEIDLY